MQQIILITTDEALEELFQKKIIEFITPLKTLITDLSGQKHNTDELLSVAETCKILGICSGTLLKLRKENKIKTVKIGRQIRVKKKSIKDFLSENQIVKSRGLPP